MGFVMLLFLFVRCFGLSMLFFCLFPVVLRSPFSGATAALSNEFTVVVVKEEASYILRTAAEGAVLQIPPYFVQLSSNWTVVEQAAPFDESMQHAEEERKLLHCRLPLPKKLETLAFLEKNYIKRHSARMRRDIWRWLMSLTPMDGCVFGDGEGLLTGVSEWYLLCPSGQILKVNMTALVALYGNSSLNSQKMIEGLRDHYAWSRGMGRSGSFDKWTTLIGEYQKHMTKPKWNVRAQAWELIYPTDRVCHASKEDVSSYCIDGNCDEDLSRQAERHTREVWKTVVQLHCQPRRGDHRLVQQWSVTEVRQACLHEVMLASPVVCEWEEKMSNLRVNPIPCIPL